jgi:hypothetical protein
MREEEVSGAFWKKARRNFRLATLSVASKEGTGSSFISKRSYEGITMGGHHVLAALFERTSSLAEAQSD